jgi:hypothetical protein
LGNTATTVGISGGSDGGGVKTATQGQILGNVRVTGWVAVVEVGVNEVLDPSRQ